MVTPQARREVVCFFRDGWLLSERRSCELASIARSTQRYLRRRREDPRLRERLLALAGLRPRYGYEMLTKLLRREGFAVNFKRVRRIYREERLLLRSKPRRKLVSAALREKPVTPDTPNRRWSMDFMRDALSDGRAFRTFNVLDDGSRESLAIDADFSLPAQRVVQTLERIGEDRGFPAEIVVDNGPEFVSHALDAWASSRGVTLRFIRPGHPVENCFVESFNGTFRRDCLDAHWFEDLAHVRRVIESWRHDYNHLRPHSALGDLTPAEYAALRSLPPPTDRSGPHTPDRLTN